MKKLKNSLPLLLTLSLIITAMVSVSPVHASPTALSVIFSNGTNSSIGEYFPTDEFTVDINIEDVTILYAFDFTLSYYTTALTATAVVPGSLFPENSLIWIEEINNDLGYVRYLVSMPTGTPRGEGASGSGTLATILFTVNTLDATILDLRNTKLANGNVQLIPHDVNDGYFNAAGGVVEVALYEWKLKVNEAAGIGKGHKSTVGEVNTLKAYVTNTGTFGANVQVVFKITDAAFTPVATVKSSIVPLPAGSLPIQISVTWTAGEVDVYLITAYLFYGPYSTDSFSRTQILSVLP